MAHEISLVNGIYEFAYLASDGLTWHGLGQPVDDNQPIDTWLQASNMGNWNINSAPSMFFDKASGKVVPFNDNLILYRSDNLTPLSTVSPQYNIVQPRAIVEFFADIIERMGFQMATCGVLFGGKKFWAMANIGQTVNILGKDRVDGKLLVATSCDGTMKTTFQYTTTRVVCNNTLRVAVGQDADVLKVSHGTVLDADQVKTMLGLNDTTRLEEWARLGDEMARYKLAEDVAIKYLAEAMNVELDDDGDQEDVFKNNSVKKVFELYNGGAKGSGVAPGTLWQALNSVTEYCDHHRKTRTADSRVDSTHFGQFGRIKDRAWQLAEQKILLAA